MKDKTDSVDYCSITEILRLRILRGDYKPGEKLSENSLSKEFNCSRTPIREALKNLESSKLVKIQPHSGTYVHVREPEENIEIVAIRSYFEALAFVLACERNADTTALSALCDQMEYFQTVEKPDAYMYGQTHYTFHHHLIELSGNKTLLDLYDRLHLNSAQAIFYLPKTPEDMKLTNEEHRIILNNLKERNAEAGRDFMITHLWNRRKRLEVAYQKQKQEQES